MNTNSDDDPHCEENGKLHWKLVHDLETSAEVLHEICESLPTFLLERLAQHPNAAQHTLVRLSMHDDTDVRSAVTENFNTPMDVLEYMVNDESPDVRYSMAENHNLPRNLLISLCDDDNPYVSSRAQKTLIRLQENKCVQAQFNSYIGAEKRTMDGSS